MNVEQVLAENAFWWAGEAIKARTNAKNKVFGGQYVQQDWEKSLRYEDHVVRNAEYLMARLEHSFVLHNKEMP